jgi:membrane protease YdiL (CAAX protease family)
MGQLTTKEIQAGLLIWMGLAILFGSVASWIWAVRRLLRDEPILPERPMVEHRKPNWGWGMLLVLLAFLVVNVGGFTGYAIATRGRTLGKRPDAPPRVEKKEAPKPGPAGADHSREASPTPGDLSYPELMFVQAAINSLLIVLLPLILRVTAGVRLSDLGLSFKDWRRQVTVGVVAILMLLPIIYVVQALCVRYLDVPDAKDRAHPVQKMIQEDPTGPIAYLAVLTAVLLAPAFEELLFRGILQTWLIRVLDDIHLALRRKRTRHQPAPTEKPEPAVDNDWVEGPIAEDGYWAEDPPDGTTHPPLDPSPNTSELPDDPAETKDLPYRPHSARAAGTAIVLTSLLFALLHAPQWPAPIPLFILSMGLGIVTYRTGGLLSAICMHAFFNGVSTVMMFLTLGLEPTQDKPVPPPPPTEKVAPLENVKPDLPNLDRVR